MTTNELVDKLPSPPVTEDEINDSDMSDSSSDEEQEAPATKPLPKKTKTVAPKAPRAPKKTKAVVAKKPPIKTKKTRTVRRPYKSMAQDKLVAKQAVAAGRFELANKRMGIIQCQLHRFDHEIATRAAMPPAVPEEECVEAPPAVV